MDKKSVFYEELKAMEDLKYKEFNSKLIPNVSHEKMIGIRIPVLRNFAKKVYKERNDDCRGFLRALPHYYFEENNLHAMLIENIKDIDDALNETEKFLPYIDNWQTCDIFSPKVFKKHRDKVLKKAVEWMGASDCYTVRYGIGLLLSNYLDEYFDGEHPEMVAAVRSEEYYVNMMIAWYFSTALAKQYEKAVKIIEEGRLAAWTHNKAIQKAIESYRVPKERKEYLRGLKVKE